MLYSTTVEFRGKKKELKNLSKSSDKQIIIVCPDCNKVFSRYAKVLFATGNFLCQACTLKDIGTKTLKVGSVYNKFTVVESNGNGVSVVKCECGTVKDVGNYAITSGGTKSCGCLISQLLKEFYKRNPGIYSGEKHSNWKGGTSSLRERHMSTTEYKDWRTAVFSRDSYKCKKCGINSNLLEAHHIVSYADNESLRVDVDNGITLCKSHHNEFHKIYGRAGIEAAHINEYLTENQKEIE